MKKVGFLIVLLLRMYLSGGQSLLKDKNIISQSYSQRWELDSIDKQGTFGLALYKPNYITPARVTNTVNKMPQSENPMYSASEPINYDKIETKFQLSLKTKIIQSVFRGKGDFWLAYTQVAHLQTYNSDLSRVMREINYEPEVIFIYPLDVRVFGGKLKSAGVAYNHQSNGRDFPLSRSWHRLVFDVTYENKNWVVSFKPWLRLGEGTDIDSDENPAITDYIGDGELSVFYSYKMHQFYSLVTHPFTHLYGGSIQLNYIFPIKGLLRGHIQCFSGYGETLIDYNFYQTTLGVGVSLANW